MTSAVALPAEDYAFEHDISSFWAFYLHDLSGSGEETDLRSSGEEEEDPQQHQEPFEEGQTNQLDSERLCSVADVSTVETSSEEQPGGERHTETVQDDIIDPPVTEAKAEIDRSPKCQLIERSLELKVPEAGNTDLCERGTKSSGVDTHSDEEQGNTKGDMEESHVNAEFCSHVAEPDESVPVVSNNEAHQAPENVEAESHEAEEVSKPEPQGGRKKRKKRRGKKKGGNHEQKMEQKEGMEGNGTDQKICNKEKDPESARRDSVSASEWDVDGPVPERTKEAEMDPVTNEEERQETEEVDAVELTENVSIDKTLEESKMDHLPEDKLSLETEEVVKAEAETLQLKPNLQDEQDMGQTLESEEVEVGSITSPDMEASHSAADLTDDSEGTKSTDSLDKGCSVDASGGDITTGGDVLTSGGVISEEDDIGSVDEMRSECTSKNPENITCSEDTEAESHVHSNVDVAVDKSEPANDSAGGGDTTVMVSDRGPEEETENDEEQPKAQTEHGSCSPGHDDRDNSGIQLDRSEKEELHGDFGERADEVQPENLSDDLVKNNVDSQTLQCEDQIDESDVHSEAEQIDPIEMLKTPDSPKEAGAEISSLKEQDHSDEGSATAEGPEHKTSNHDQEKEECLCAVGQLVESNVDEAENKDPAQLPQQDSEAGDEEDEEGQSFDFDDMAEEPQLSMDLEEEEVEEGVQVMSDENTGGWSALCQSDRRGTGEQPADGDGEKCSVEEVKQADTTDKDSDSLNEPNSLAQTDEEKETVEVEQESTSQEKEPPADEPEHTLNVRELLVVEEIGVVEGHSAENIEPVQEGLDVIKHELQAEELPKSLDQVGSNKEPPLSGKEGKKKGKTKGREDCKMS